MLDEMFKKWDMGRAAEKFRQMDDLRVGAPTDGTLFDQLEFVEHIEMVFNKIETSNDTRQIVLEGWLLVDYIVTYLLRDALGIRQPPWVSITSSICFIILMVSAIVSSSEPIS